MKINASPDIIRSCSRLVPLDLELLDAWYPDLTVTCELAPTGCKPVVAVHVCDSAPLTGTHPVLARAAAGEHVPAEVLRVPNRATYFDGKLCTSSGWDVLLDVPTSRARWAESPHGKHCARLAEGRGDAEACLASEYAELRSPLPSFYRTRRIRLPWQRRGFDADAGRVLRSAYLLPDGTIRLSRAVEAPWWVGLPGTGVLARRLAEKRRGYHRPGIDPA